MPSRSGLHFYAIALTVLLFGAFVAATTLYANYGRAVVLRVFEENQLQRATTSRDMMAVLHLADYVRVDPSSIDMRGRLVDALIQNNRALQALETALAGLRETPRDELPLAQLVVARAAIAAGDADRANNILAEFARDPAAPAEAWYHLALLSAARGDFPRMRDAFDRLRSAGPSGSTQQFLDDWNAARSILDLPSSAPALDPAARVQALLVVGRFDDAIPLILSREFALDQPRLLFWRGVQEELQGRADAAQTLYKTGAARGDALAKFALTRLSA